MKTISRKMVKVKAKAAFTLALLAVIGGGAFEAHARTMLGGIGRAESGALYNCFGGGVFGENGNCRTGVMSWIVPTYIDHNGTFNVTMTTSSHQSGPDQCRAVALAKDGTMVSASPFTSLGSAGVKNILATVVAPSFGMLYFDCDLQFGQLIGLTF